MEQLIQAFGIDVKLIVVQIVNFAILMVVLTYFLYKPVLKVLSDRHEKVTQGIKDAEAAAAAKAAAETEKQAVLTSAHQDAESINERAKVQADQRAASIVADADEKAAAIVANGETKAVELQQKAMKDSEAEIAKLAILAAEKVLKEKTT